MRQRIAGLVTSRNFVIAGLVSLYTILAGYYIFFGVAVMALGSDHMLPTVAQFYLRWRILPETVGMVYIEGGLLILSRNKWLRSSAGTLQVIYFVHLIIAVWNHPEYWATVPQQIFIVAATGAILVMLYFGEERLDELAGPSNG